MAVKPDSRVVIVTGAGTGLGRAYALDLARRGLRVVVNNRRRDVDAAGQGSAQRVVREIEAAGGAAVAEESDVRDPASGGRMVARALEAWGRLDAVVANAGVDQHLAFHKIGVPQFREIFEVNFFGSLYVVHAAFAHLRAHRHGRIVVSTSSAGLHGLHGLSAYAAAKAALIGLMRSLAGEGRDHDVLCNAVAPYAATRMTEAHADADFAARMPPEGVAPLVAALISERCRVTGEIFVAGGGGYRRAVMLEESAVRPVPDEIARSDGPLAASARSFPDALAAFENFMAELQQVDHAYN